MILPRWLASIVVALAVTQQPLDAAADSNPFGGAASAAPGTLPPYNTVPSWGDSTPQVTGGRNPLYVVYDQLRYDDATLAVTTTPIPGPDFSKIFNVLGLATGSGQDTAQRLAISGVPYAASDPVFILRDATDPAIRVKQCRAAQELAILSCRAALFRNAAVALSRIYQRDSQSADRAQKTVFDTVAVFDQKLREHVGEIPSIPGTNVAFRNDVLASAINAATVLSEQLGLSDRASQLTDYRSVLGDNPGQCTIEQGVAPVNPGSRHVADPLIEVNDACADALATERSDLLQVIALSKLSAAEKQNLSAQLIDVAPYLLNYGATAGAVRTAFGKNLDLIQSWTNRFTNVKTMQFFLTTMNAGCNSGFNGSTNKVHIKATDALPAASGGGKDLDRDVVVFTCNSSFMKSVGLGYSSLPTTSYNVIGLATPNAAAPGTFTTTYTLRGTSDTGRLVGAVLAHRCLCPNPGDGLNTAFSFGLGSSVKDAVELVTGLSVISQRKFFLTVGAHYGAVSALAPGSNALDSAVPSDYKINTVKQYQTRFTALLSLGL